MQWYLESFIWEWNNSIRYFFSLFKQNKANIIDDSKSLEFIFSEEQQESDVGATIELTFKKTITINNANCTYIISQAEQNAWLSQKQIKAGRFIQVLGFTTDNKVIGLLL